MEQYLLGLVSGMLVTGFGVWLSGLLASHKDKLTDRNIFKAFKEELLSNLEMLSANCVELENELDVVGSDQHSLTALTPYYFSTWDILKTHIPDELSSKAIFRQLSLTMHLSLLTNNEIAAREQFKSNGVALTNFSEMLRKRDELLLMRNAELLKRILKLREVLGLNMSFSSPSHTLTQTVNDFNESQKGS